MIEEDDAKAKVNTAQHDLETILKQKETLSAQLLEEKEKLLSDFENAQNERKAAVASTPPEDLKLYENIRKSHKGIAIAKINNQACSACGATLNTSLLTACRSPDRINQCPNCGRILYLS